MIFEIGDTVEHKTFGQGIVQKSNRTSSQVLFKKTNEVKDISNNFLTFVKKASKAEHAKELKVYPSNYLDIQVISKPAAELADYLKKESIDGNLYLDIALFDDKDRKFSFLISSRGLTIFEFVLIDEQVFNVMRDMSLNIIETSKETLINKIKNHLLLSKELVLDNQLIVPIEHYLFIDSSKEWFLKHVPNNINATTCESTFIDNRKQQLLDRHIKTVANMLAPQYIVVLTRNSNHLNPRLKEMNINSSRANGIELSILKDEQINTLHNLKKGIEFVLANAGAGKSVILLAKAYELCSLNYQNVLLTCYNSNLAEEYRYKSEECGMNDKKDLYIMTFHKFVKKYCHDFFQRDFEIEDIEDAVEFLTEKASSIRNMVRFDAILIDEMQIFKPEWLDLCYLLLAEPKDESFFIMAGDINQDVKGVSKNANLNFFETKYIPEEKKNINIKYLNYNYRNTIQISNVLNKMLINHTNLLRLLDIDRVEKIENYILGESISNGPSPKYIKTERGNITDSIIEEIIRLKQEYKLQYGDIAVIFPYQEKTYKKYFLSSWLKGELARRGIPFNFIFGDKNKINVSSIDGVVLSTVDSALGLDFKAVIVCGLYTLTSNNFEDGSGKVKSMKIGKTPNNNNPNAFNEFVLVEGYKLYIACSRARDYLTVINDIDDDNILVDSIFKECF